MSAYRNDSTVQYGSLVLSIGTVAAGNPPTLTGGVSYVADNITVNHPSKTIERTNEIDEPSGQVSYIGFVTGSATIQLATGSIAPPTLGKGFKLTVFDTNADGDVTATEDDEWFYIDSVDQPHDKAGEKKVNITFRKIVGTT